MPVRAVSQQETITHHIDAFLDHALTDPEYARQHGAIEVFKRRPEFLASLKARLEEELETVLLRPDAHRAFRDLLINTMKVSVIYGTLMSFRFVGECDGICRSVNRGMKRVSNNRSLRPLGEVVRAYEAEPAKPWGFTKSVYESAWADLKLAVLENVQTWCLGPASRTDKDQLARFRAAYEHYISEFYNLVIHAGTAHAGFPHPIVTALLNDALTEMEREFLDDGA